MQINFLKSYPKEKAYCQLARITFLIFLINKLEIKNNVLS